MNAGRDSDAVGIVSLALAFHRAPTQHADLLHGRGALPAGVGVLLKLAGGSEPDPGCAALAHPDELKAAALFFVEQAMFRRDASHYRVLGLEPGASPGQIKEHHRLLMRVFHPDRENRADDWKDAFATRINLAYSCLRDPDARRRYDAVLRPATRPAMAPPPARRTAAAPKPIHPPSRLSGLTPLVSRHLPQWVLTGSALIACLVVGAVYLGNPPKPAPLAGSSHPDTRVGAAAAVPAYSLADRPAPSASPPLGQARMDSSPRRMPATSSPVPPDSGFRRHDEGRISQRFPDTPAGGAPLPPPVSTTAAAAPVAAPPPIAAVGMSALPVPTPGNVPPEARPAEDRPAPAPAPPLADPDATLARFKSSYERGDTQAFMALFDEVAIGETGGKPQIRQAHDALFRSTDLRHIAIDDMAWSREGDWIRGEGHYRTTLMRKGELRLRTESGVIRIELLRRGDRALIMGLDYLPSGRS